VCHWLVADQWFSPVNLIPTPINVETAVICWKKSWRYQKINQKKRRKSNVRQCNDQKKKDTNLRKQHGEQLNQRNLPKRFPHGWTLIFAGFYCLFISVWLIDIDISREGLWSKQSHFMPILFYALFLVALLKDSCNFPMLYLMYITYKNKTTYQIDFYAI
jgi:hypothetical protein